MSGAALLFLVAATRAGAVAPGLAGGQELYRQNHWAEAREHLRGAWPGLSEKEKPAATFLIGRSYGREAEFYEAVHRFTVDAGREYLGELKAMPGNRASIWIPLFAAFYELEAGRYGEAERALAAAAKAPTLPAEWKASALLRRRAALQRLGRSAEAKVVAVPARAPDAAAESSYWAAWAAPSAAAPGAAGALSRRARLASAATLYRAGQAAEADRRLEGLDLDAHDVEDKPDAQKTLRFFDPLVSQAWARVCWERSARELRPLAEKGRGSEAVLAAYYRGLSLWWAGAPAEAAAQMKSAMDDATLGDAASLPRLVTAAAEWGSRAPAAAVLGPLWQGTLREKEAVVFWAELAQRGPAKSLAGGIAAALREPPGEGRTQGALVGRWAFARLALGAEPREVLDVLEALRDKSNKNKLESNDPMLLLAICATRAKSLDYAQALETLFEVGKTLPGLRPLQWNLQGLYAARQKAGGETRISQ